MAQREIYPANVSHVGLRHGFDRIHREYTPQYRRAYLLSAVVATTSARRRQFAVRLSAVFNRSKGGLSMTKKFYSVKEVATILGVSKSLIYAGVQKGKIPHRRIMGRILIPASFVDDK